jgi:sterol-4alpha-carboxylate 3-dehydrogenase (decarboxylating)
LRNIEREVKLGEAKRMLIAELNGFDPCEIRGAGPS